MLIAIPQEDGTLSVVKCAIDPVWFLPGIAERFKLEEAKLRQNLFEQVGARALIAFQGPPFLHADGLPHCMLMASLSLHADGLPHCTPLRADWRNVP